MKLPLLFLAAVPLFVLTSAALSQTTAPLPAQIPKPPGLKVVFESPDTAIYESPGSAEEARATAAKILTAAGWQPYGEAGETRYYKQGKVRALVTISAPSAPGRKTMLSYNVEAMNADLPAPPGVADIRYTDKRLGFIATQSPDEVAAAFLTVLSPADWTTTMTKPVKDELDFVIIYRHPTEGMIELSMRPGEKSLLATATYKTQQEVDAETAKAAAQGAALKKKLAAEAAAPPPEVTLSLPKGVTNHFQTKAGLAIKLTPGTAMAGAQKISAELEVQGWKTGQAPPLARQTGMIEMTRETLRLSIVYMDPGFVPAEITITAPKMAFKVRR